jgi:hypothetical protein
MPRRQPAGRRYQLQVADAGMVAMFQPHAGFECPVAPFRVARRARKDAAIGQNDDAVGEMVLGVEVNRNPGNNVLPGGETFFYNIPPRVRQVAGGSVGEWQYGGHSAANSMRTACGTQFC